MGRLNPLSAAYFEEGKYDECIGMCNKAIEVGREQRAYYSMIAKWVGLI